MDGDVMQDFITDYLSEQDILKNQRQTDDVITAEKITDVEAMPCMPVGKEKFCECLIT